MKRVTAISGLGDMYAPHAALGWALALGVAVVVGAGVVLLRPKKG